MSQGCKDSVNEFKRTREDKQLMNSNLEQAKDKKEPKKVSQSGQSQLYLYRKAPIELWNLKEFRPWKIIVAEY